ncbi:ABC transporter ATP-binding protein/permease [Convivina praedatoris]|uniref:Macrolide export ATP-binding/permease protein MacB n=1 Tax=Convivina praedatoris TaxID=2880963 RepID=A0ABM9D193_9LACO|nr:ABC transporter ATP-binding protein/permease [Convivina sp. LMG 32447]CAH1851502.1 Macrolide export ATP-binding/permease protein MacB [Convivina sp. LMG 32447]CAH1853545.1 Macrolide export ATP-binding/permease protein MacB [Convivina sp. LMG 32447]CAH1854497.1 Macrolide export ATP-binding/permease protein MacB [Convivina sp. LMG 32447]
MAFLELQDIYKSYFLGREEFPVLKGINLSFNKGEFVSILGESGGGKTTLMNIIGGLDRRFSGTVTVDGEVLDHEQEKALDLYRRKTIGYIFQSFNLINYQTNLENVETSLNMTSLSGSQRKQQAIELLKKVGLEGHINKYPSQLSGGQKQRVAIARALAGDPDIMIADEPTGALDSGNTNEVLELLDQIAREGKLVIVVTHSQDVANYGTRIVHMEDGHIDQQEQLKKPYSSHQYERNRGVKSRPLSRRTLWDMAFDHLKFKKLQNFLIILGSSIGLGAVILFLGLGSGVKGYISKQVTDTINPNYPTVTKRISTDNNASDEDEQNALSQALQDDYNATVISDENLAKLSKINHVSKVYPGYQFSGVSFTVGEQKKTGSIFTWTPAFQDNMIKAGHKPTKDGEIVIDQSFAKKINSNWKSVIGQTVTINYSVTDKVGNAVAVTGTAKVVGITKADSGINATTAETIKNQLINAGGQTAYNSVPVHVDATTNVKQVTQDIKKLQDANKHQIFNVQSVGDTLTQINTITSLASKVLAAIAGISLIVSAIMIIVTTYMSVAERTQEIGVLRALGARAKDIRSLFTNEALLMGIIAAVLAIIMALLIQVAMNAALHSMISYNIVQISTGDIILAAIMSILIAWIASYVPSRQAAHLNTIDALASN